MTIFAGIATLNPDADLQTQSCSPDDSTCHSRMLTGDNNIVMFNIQSNSWSNYGVLGDDDIFNLL